MRKFLITTTMLVAGLSLGLLSARYLMENASTAAPLPGGQWTEIKTSADDLKSIYLTGHFLQRGEVPPLKGSRFFVRQLDDDGNILRGDCVVTLEGKMPEARSWLVSADGKNQRSALDASEAVREASGDYTISISTSPVPGNWLVPPTTGSYAMTLVLLDIAQTDPNEKLVLPTVKRLWCL
jgi:hypothetical protein